MNKSVPGRNRNPSFIERSRRAQIVEAAIAVLAEQGYRKASFARIAERAGISPGLISYHFADKDDLIREIVRHVTGSLETVMSERLAGVGSYRTALRTIIETQVHYFAAHPAETLAYGAIRSSAHDGDGGPRYAAEERERSLGRIQGLLSDGQNAGEFRSFDTRWTAVSLLAALEAVPGELRARGDTDVRRYAEELAALFDLATRAS